MASKAYRAWVARDVERAAPPPPPSRGQRLKTWWYYHKGQVLIGAVLLAAGGNLLWQALGIGVPKPDFSVAYVGSVPLPEDTAAAVEEALAALAADVNGDGQVIVSLRQYVSPQVESETAAEYRLSAELGLIGDLESHNSAFFLMERYDDFQKGYGVLAGADGHYLGAEEPAQACEVYRWQDCPALAGQSLGTYTQTVLGQEQTGENQALLAGLYLGRRGTAEGQAYPEAEQLLWETCIQEAAG